MKQPKLNKIFDWYGNMSCLGCGESLSFYKDGCIKVNCFSKGVVQIDGLWITRGCKNPLCKWSNAK